jgi:hypothetical protein
VSVASTEALQLSLLLRAICEPACAEFPEDVNFHDFKGLLGSLLFLQVRPRTDGHMQESQKMYFVPEK